MGSKNASIGRRRRIITWLNSSRGNCCSVTGPRVLQKLVLAEFDRVASRRGTFPWQFRVAEVPFCCILMHGVAAGHGLKLLKLCGLPGNRQSSKVASPVFLNRRSPVRIGPGAPTLASSVSARNAESVDESGRTTWTALSQRFAIRPSGVFAGCDFPLLDCWHTRCGVFP